MEKEENVHAMDNVFQNVSLYIPYPKFEKLSVHTMGKLFHTFHNTSSS